MKSTKQKHRKYTKNQQNGELIIFEKIEKMDKSSASLTKGQRVRFQINKIMNEKGNLTTEIEEI